VLRGHTAEGFVLVSVANPVAEEAEPAADAAAAPAAAPAPAGDKK
jgi:hypothetical protein